MKHWLIKSEPEEYSFARLKKEGSTWWEGVRNYQARNFMMKDMKVGDLALFYHSNAEPPGVAGIAVVSSAAKPDALQFDKKSDFYDARSKKDAPAWHCVEFKFHSDIKRFVTLEEIKKNKNLAKMLVVQRGQRLSVQPVTIAEFNEVLKMADQTIPKDLPLENA